MRVLLHMRFLFRCLRLTASANAPRSVMNTNQARAPTELRLSLRLETRREEIVCITVSSGTGRCSPPRKKHLFFQQTNSFCMPLNEPLTPPELLNYPCCCSGSGQLGSVRWRPSSERPILTSTSNISHTGIPFISATTLWDFKYP